MKILIVEDEKKLAEAVAFRLEKENYAVDIVFDGEAGLDSSLTDVYDLIILDVMLPKLSGFEALREMRSRGIGSKVIMLTAKSMIEDKLCGFDCGADDYLTKPFHMDELVARINAQLRKGIGNKRYVLKAGDLRLDTLKKRLICSVTEEGIDVIAKEYQLLEYFMLNRGQVLSREQLYTKVWGFESEAESNNLEAYLSFIRRKLEAVGSKTKIKAVRGVGYRMEIVDEEAEK